MKKILIAALVIMPAAASPVHVKLDAQQTAINFTVVDVLHTVHGIFKLTDGEIWIDPETGKAGGEIMVAAGSGSSGNRARDARMSKSVLQAGQFPMATFTPNRMTGEFKQTGESTFQLHGKFSIHGTTHELTMSVKSHADSEHVRAEASFNVPYVEWGMKDPSTLFLRVSNTVKIDIAALGAIR
jgi:polyisoprenoid-binding protein YceI